jgi:hypothetical protein
MAGYTGTRYAVRCRKCNAQSEPSVYPLDAVVEAREHYAATTHKGIVWIVRNGRFAQHASEQPMYTRVYNA